MELKIEKASFDQISLKQVSDALKKGLSKNYIDVDVSIVQCPDLTNWGCPAEGISGNQKIVDVGGEPRKYQRSALIPFSRSISRSKIRLYDHQPTVRCKLENGKRVCKTRSSRPEWQILSRGS